MAAMPFPETLLRGVPNDTFLVEDGSVGSHLFYFDDQPREDGNIERSINWEDDDGALATIFTQRKENGDPQFRAGAVRIPREELDRLANRPTVRSILSYERSPLPSNPYHGNLLMQSTVEKRTMKTIAAGIALAVSEVIRRPPAIPATS
jgi:hypothetical protein